ncbi:MAG TPA: response regulator transcription factor [Bacteroidales bacterium]
MIKVAIIEDNHALRNSLESLFSQTDGMHCVASLKNLLNVVNDLNTDIPDVVLMDIGLPGIDGIDGVKIVRNYFPSVRILMFTVFEDDDKIFDSICAGASGYILKKSTPDEIVKAIMDLYAGGAPMSPSIANRTLQLFREKLRPELPDYGLTNREREILEFLSEGLSYQKIADKLMISLSTVRTHITNIYEKLQVNSKVEAIRKIKRS